LGPTRTEGEENGEWIIVDCGAAVVHLMQPSIRDYYHLEEIWGDKPVKLKVDASPVRLVKASEPAPKPKAVVARRPAAKAAPAKKPVARKAAAKRAPVGVKAGVTRTVGVKTATKQPVAKKAPARKTAARA